MLSYLNVSDTSALASLFVPRPWPGFEAFAGLADDDERLAACVAAAADIDACGWRGKRRVSTQSLAFPRIDGRAYAISYGDTPAEVAAVTTSAPASVPHQVLIAAAIQAHKVALDALGQGETELAATMAAAGVTSYGGGGRSLGIGGRAASPWSRLHVYAQRQLGDFRATAVGVL